MKEQVAIFQDSNLPVLMQEINRYLDSTEGTLRDIKFSSCTASDSNSIYYSALLIVYIDEDEE